MPHHLIIVGYLLKLFTFTILKLIVMKPSFIVKSICILLLLIMKISLAAQPGGKSTSKSDFYNIVSYGAKSSDKTLNTIPIQKAIDECSVNGGGTVYVPAGIFLTGSLTLKNHVTLSLSKNAVLLASGNLSDYSKEQGKLSFILIDGVEDVSVVGEGVIDGQGNLFIVSDNAPDRPFLMLVNESRKIRIEDVTLRNSAMWTLKLFGNEHVIIKGISIFSHTNFNNDGIDIDSKDVVISDCIIDCDDDALCFKTDSKKASENVVVTNCILASNCNFIKFGTASRGGFKNISISNCTLRHASESNHRTWIKMPGITDSITGISGIALEVVDGGFMEQVTINNITMDGVQTPVFMRLGSRRTPVGYLKNVIISNIVATTHSKIPCLISGIPGFYIENVVLKDMIINCKGEGEAADVNKPVPENEKGYPENRMFGPILPAYGMYIRHARNIEIDNVQFNLLKPDFRPAIYFDDVKDITVRNLKASKPSGIMEVIMKKEKDEIKILN
jgi:polygalacturonase